MATPALVLELIHRAAREQGGGSACSAGYPDLLVTAEQLSILLGADAVQRIPVRDDSANIIAWHQAGRWFDRVFDSASVFREMGYSLDVIDIQAARGDEIIVDLNFPLPPDFGRSYDLVLDPGTCEHCFHIGQAAMNLASLVKPQGYLIQAMPLNAFNHGFYNINPTFFYDFYPVNGFEILYLKGVSSIVTHPQIFDPLPFERFHEAPRNSIMILVAKRLRAGNLQVPVQHKYQSNPKLGNE